MFLKIPFITMSLKRRLWMIIIMVVAYMVYTALGDLIPQYWNFLGFRTWERSVLTLGFLVILLIALSGLGASEKLALLANKDSLTGLFNQIYVKSRLQEEIYQAERYSYPLSLLMIDLDDFKLINDKHGHVAGDRVLKDFSGLIQDMIRASDTLGRFGGEEFLLILPHTLGPGAVMAAERIRKTVALKPFRIEAQGKKVCQLTISIGIYSSPFEGQNVDGVIHRADEALYRAKREGKNKVVAFKK